MDNSVEVIPQASPPKAATSGKNLNISDMKPEQLEVAIESEKKRRALISEFVKSQMVDGTDFGTINLGGSKVSKPCLFKPGMEKIYSLFGIRSELSKDEVTLSMIDTKNVICYICHLYKGNTLIGEGRGACSIQEKQNNINTAIKIAEKRARMDACLNIGFSEHFTQDLDDMPLQPPAMPPATQGAASKAYGSDARPAGTDAPRVEQGNEYGECTIFIQKVQGGISAKTGKPWGAVITELGRFWNNSDEELLQGVTYDVEIEGDKILRVIHEDDQAFLDHQNDQKA